MFAPYRGSFSPVASLLSVCPSSIQIRAYLRRRLSNAGESSYGHTRHTMQKLTPFACQIFARAHLNATIKSSDRSKVAFHT